MDDDLPYYEDVAGPDNGNAKSGDAPGQQPFPLPPRVSTMEAAREDEPEKVDSARLREKEQKKEKDERMAHYRKHYVFPKEDELLEPRLDPPKYPFFFFKSHLSENVPIDVAPAFKNVPNMNTPWVPVRILGKGGQGVASLWRNGSQRVVMKTTIDDEKFVKERALTIEAGRTGGNHVVQLHDVDDEEGNPLQRLYFRYCEGGDLQKVIQNQRLIGSHSFDEVTLWRYFECLVRALCILDHRTELPQRPQGPVDPICHFDIKPHNILLGGRDLEEHRFRRVAKIADFGCAILTSGLTWEERGRIRDAGTPGYLLPEQFTAHWEEDGYRNDGLCGNYDTHSNIFQVGLCMYQLATLSSPPLPVPTEVPGINGSTYGGELADTKYSQALKTIIWSCLRELPADRVQLQGLHDGVANGLGISEDEQERRDGPPIPGVIRINGIAVETIVEPGDPQQDKIRRGTEARPQKSRLRRPYVNPNMQQDGWFDMTVDYDPGRSVHDIQRFWIKAHLNHTLRNTKSQLFRVLKIPVPVHRMRLFHVDGTKSLTDWYGDESTLQDCEIEGGSWLVVRDSDAPAPPSLPSSPPSPLPEDDSPSWSSVSGGSGGGKPSHPSLPSTLPNPPPRPSQTKNPRPSTTPAGHNASHQASRPPFFIPSQNSNSRAGALFPTGPQGPSSSQLPGPPAPLPGPSSLVPKTPPVVTNRLTFDIAYIPPGEPASAIRQATVRGKPTTTYAKICRYLSNHFDIPLEEFRVCFRGEGPKVGIADGLGADATMLECGVVENMVLELHRLDEEAEG